jgi:hypothetical protein
MIGHGLQLRDLEVHTIQSAVKVTAPEEPIFVGDLNKLPDRSSLPDQGRYMCQLIKARVYVESCPERVAAELCGASPHESRLEGTVEMEHPIKESRLFPFEPKIDQLLFRFAVKAHLNRAGLAEYPLNFGLIYKRDSDRHNVIVFPIVGDPNALGV